MSSTSRCCPRLSACMWFCGCWLWPCFCLVEIPRGPHTRLLYPVALLHHYMRSVGVSLFLLVGILYEVDNICFSIIHWRWRENWKELSFSRGRYLMVTHVHSYPRHVIDMDYNTGIHGKSCFH